MSLSPSDWTAIFLTFKLAFVSTCLLLCVGIPIAWWLSKEEILNQSFVRKSLSLGVEALVSLPIVLPPTVMGFYLLMTFGSQSPVGTFLHSWLDLRLVFSFPGLVVGSVIYSLPFVVQPIQNSFVALGQRPLEIAKTLGMSSFESFVKVALPMSRSGIISASILGFAHTLGEFGVVLMIGGNIPGKTRVLSIAIYEHVESLEYEQAHVLSAGMLGISFLLLLAVFASKRTGKTRFPSRRNDRHYGLSTRKGL